MKTKNHKEPQHEPDFCVECLKKEGEIEMLEQMCAMKDKRIEDLLIKISSGSDDCLVVTMQSYR